MADVEDLPPARANRRRRRTRTAALALVVLLAAGWTVWHSTRPLDLSGLGPQPPERIADCERLIERSQAARDRVEAAERVAGQPLEAATFVDGSRCLFAFRADEERIYVLAGDREAGDPDSIAPIGSGCGEGALRTLVIDWKLRDACDAHDLCYLFRRDPDTGATRSRGECDRALARAGRRACERSYDGGLRGAACRVHVAGIAFGTRLLGPLAWRDRD